ncbi:MAG: hypothetical protein J5777_08610 [Clostridiales bacterium]|nr:hypothetical protein [Clostridiales bacterium]
MRIKFKRRRPSQIVAVAIVAAMLLTLLTACSIDYTALSEGLSELGSAIDFSYNQTPATPGSEETTSESETSGSKETSETTSETTESSAESSETSETDETSETSESSAASETSETSETSESSETTTSEPTPTPTPHPTNERVDFSYLRTTNLSETFSVNSEEFSEKVDAGENTLAVFSGKRMVVSNAGSENVSEAINLILDSFYQEAAGLYSRYSGEAKAAYNLSGVVDTVYNTEVNFDYSYNKRILSVIMSYKVTAGKAVLASSEEYASFDMLTGQYITLASVAEDWAGLQNALKLKLAKNEPISSASGITDLYVAAQQPGAQTATIEIYGTYGGKRFHTTGDMNEYAQFLNRYGKIIFGTSENNENAQ